MVSESPSSMSLAIVPTGYKSRGSVKDNQLFGGKRGADLEIAVREAITEGSVGKLGKMKLCLEEILGSDELKNKGAWQKT